MSTMSIETAPIAPIAPIVAIAIDGLIVNKSTDMNTD